MRWPRVTRRRVLVAAVTGGALVVAGPWALVSATGHRERYPVAAVPARPVALVFGAGLLADGTPSPFLAHRLDLAVELWQRGTVQHVLVSGDHSTVQHDEVGAMTDYLVDHGVPADRVTQDHAGFTTYDSCYRARAVFGVTSAVVVTQDYHVARALWTCRRLGVDAVGVGARESYAGQLRETAKDHAREFLADGKAVAQTLVTHPLPRFLGPREVVR